MVRLPLSLRTAAGWLYLSKNQYLPLINWNCSHPDTFPSESTNNPPVMPRDPENKPNQRDRMTLIVFLQPRCFLLYFHVCTFYSSSPPEWCCQISRCGSFLPSYLLSSLGVVPGWCVSSVIPSSWNRDICGHVPRLTDGCSAREMEPVHRARKVGETQTACSDLLNHSHCSSLLHRENLSGSIRSLLGFDFICFSCGRGLCEPFRLISLIVLMSEQEKNKSQAVLVASKYLSSLGNRAESEAWVHIQDEFLLLLVLCPFPHCFPHANKGPFWCPLCLLWPGQAFQLWWFASQLMSASPSNLSGVEKACQRTLV